MIPNIISDMNYNPSNLKKDVMKLKDYCFSPIWRVLLLLESICKGFNKVQRSFRAGLF